MFEWIFKLNSIILWLTMIMKKEFNMYFWHLWEVDKRKNYRWLHNMFYDLIQQIIHQLLIYYLAYIILHNNHNWWLIFYFYYVKYQDSFNKIFFHHIDLNILCLIKNKKNTNLIQESVSLDSEWHNNCIKMLLKMHHHLDSWWEDIQTWLKVKNKSVFNDFIHWIIHNE